MEKRLSDIGVAGLAVMGANLARNLAAHSYKVSVINRTREKTDAFITQYGNEGDFRTPENMREFIDSLERPRRIFAMIKAGTPVDEFIELVLPHLDPGDIIIDGGNSFYADTARRCEYLKTKGILFVGCGVSGGEEGALNGPAMMPGGNPDAWPRLKNIFQDIAAKYNGTPCCEWIGPGASGHFVKTVHNGIEYADMQLIAEAYLIMHNAMKMSDSDISRVFDEWNKGELESFLVALAARVLRRIDPVTGKELVEMILDVAAQKGTGKWTAGAALELGVPAPTLAQGVFTRFMSALKKQRVAAAALIARETIATKELSTDELRDAMYTAKLCAYAQGFALMKAASEKYSWDLDLSVIASLWRSGCIIRAGFLNEISNAFKMKKGLENLLAAPYFIERTHGKTTALRKTAVFTASTGTAAPCFADALSYLDSYTSPTGGANMVQALRDCFGAHTFVRADDPEGKSVHDNWTA